MFFMHDRKLVCHFVIDRFPNAQIALGVQCTHSIHATSLQTKFECELTSAHFHQCAFLTGFCKQTKRYGVKCAFALNARFLNFETFLRACLQDHTSHKSDFSLSDLEDRDN